jgi:hypothetical protein
VSTDGQSLQAQTEALHSAGCGRVYSEKLSGAYADRRQLAKALAALAEGDTLVVCKLDRLARSTRDLLNTLDVIGKARYRYADAFVWSNVQIPTVTTLHTLADVRELVQRHLPAECREREAWRHVSDHLSKAARGGDINDAVVSLRLVLQLERVPCLPQ